MNNLTWSDFQKVELRVGTIISVEDFPKAKNPSFIVKVDFGKVIGIKKSSAQITELYTKESLLGKKVIAVTNFPAKQIGPIMSECLVTGFHREDGAVVLSVPDNDIPNGTRLA
ncbi:tRNA-binding protein [Thalassotalea sp. 42_200_T64]|nr:tRNA-binding protein [Thalassotalea sp. 42_200_T64]